MDNLDRLVSRIRDKAARTTAALPPPASLDSVRKAEARLGFPLPDLLAAIYTHVGDGGFGPGADVPIPGYNVARLYSLDRMVELYFQSHHPPAGSPFTPWPDGVVPMLNWGGFSEAAIDFLDKDAPVLRYDSDVDTVEPDSAWKVEAPDLATWWEHWLQDARREPVESLWSVASRNPVGT